jgi:hypothetical protein
MKIWTTDLGPDGMLDTWVEKSAYDEANQKAEELFDSWQSCLKQLTQMKAENERLRDGKWPIELSEAAVEIDRLKSKLTRYELSSLDSLNKRLDSALALIEVLKTALDGMVRFGTELCEDVKVSTHQYSIERAREALAAERSFREGGK